MRIHLKFLKTTFKQGDCLELDLEKIYKHFLKKLNHDEKNSHPIKEYFIFTNAYFGERDPGVNIPQKIQQKLIHSCDLSGIPRRLNGLALLEVVKYFERVEEHLGLTPFNRNQLLQPFLSIVFDFLFETFGVCNL